MFLSFLPSPRPAPFGHSPISRSPCHESPDRSINYAPYALAGIPQPVPVFAPLLIRALSLVCYYSFVCSLVFPVSPSNPHSISLRSRRHVSFLFTASRRALTQPERARRWRLAPASYYSTSSSSSFPSRANFSPAKREPASCFAELASFMMPWRRD